MNMLKYNCEKCNKKYKGHSGLWKHKQLCKESTSEINTEIKECKYECNIVIFNIYIGFKYNTSQYNSI